MGVRAVAMALRFGTVCLLPLWLEPSEIGYMALILAMVNLPAAFCDLGLGTALVREKDVPPRMLDTVHTAVAASSTVIAAALIAAAPLVESAFGLPRPYAMAAAFAVPFHALAIVPNAILQRDLRFHGLALRDLVGEVAFSASAIAIAAAGCGALSIVAAVLLHRIVRWAAASLTVSWHPRLVLCTADLRRLASFSLYQCASLSLTQLFYQIDKLLLAAYLTPGALGLYAQAQQITAAPVQSLSNTAKNVFFASFAKIQNDEETLRTLFSRIVKGYLIAAGAAVAVATPAVHLVPLVYSESWRAVVPIATTLCLFLPAFCAFLFEGIMIAIGGERRRVASTAIQCAILVAGIVGLFALFPEYGGPVAVALVLGVATTVPAIINYHFIARRLRIRHAQFLPHLLAAIAMAAAGIALSWFLR